MPPMRLLYREALTIIPVLCSLTLFSCSSDRRGIRIAPQQLTALSHIQELSGWSFEMSRARIHLRERGAIEVIIDGNVTPQSNPDRPLWFPVVLLRNPPEYFQAEDSLASEAVSLEAYALSEDLWCITAVVKRPPQVVNLKLLLVSAAFNSELPLLLPAVHTRNQVDLAVDLPRGGFFSKTRVAVTGESGRFPLDLAVLPILSPNENAVTAAANLHPNKTTVWDFSNLAYSFGTPPRWRPWFPPSVSLIGLSTLAICAWLSQRRVASLRAGIARTQNAVILLYGGSEPSTARYEHAQMLRRELDQLSSRLLRGPIWISRAAVRESRRVLWHLADELRSAALYSPSEARASYVHATDDIAELGSLLTGVIPWAVLLARWSILLVSSCLVILTLIWLLASFAEAQSGPVKLAIEEEDPALYDFALEAAPNNSDPRPSNAVDIGFTFYATTDSASALAPREISIEHGRMSNLQIRNVTVQPAALPTRQSGNTLSITVPSTSAPEFFRIRAAAEVSPMNRQFQKGADYQDSLDAAKQTTVHYSLSGAQLSKQWTHWTWLHRFPFDEVQIRFPLKFTKPVILWKIDLVRPWSEFDADPVMNGLSWRFSLADDGRTYRASGPGDDFRWTLLPGEEVVLNATFQRNALQRYGLTAGLLLIAIAVGVFLGWLTKLADHSWQSQVVTVVGVLGIPFVVRTAIFSSYKNLPNALTLAGVTIFDFFFLLDVLALVGACIITRRKLP